MNGSDLDQKAEGEISTSALIETVRGHGCSVNEPKLRRWVSEGLLPSGRRSETGKTRPRLYPSACIEQVVVLCGLAQNLPGLKAVGWELWWLGYPVSDQYWLRPLKAAAHEWDSKLTRLRPGFGREHRELPDAALDAIESIRAMNVPPSFVRQIRKRIGEQTDSMLIDLIRVSTGRFRVAVDWQTDPDAEGSRIIQRGLGLDRGRTEALRQHLGFTDAAPDAGEALTWLAISLSNRSARAVLKHASSSQLIEARDELRKAKILLGHGIDTLRLQRPKLGSSLNTMQEFARSNRELDQKHLLIWLLLGYKSQLRQGVRHMIARVPG